MSKVNIFVAKSDVSGFFSQKKQFLVYQKIQENYGKKASFRNKVLYYFCEKEIKKKIVNEIGDDLQEKISKNIFFDEEINSIVHRSHIEKYYPISKQVFDNEKGKNKKGIDDILNKEINDFILRKGYYERDEESISRISSFLTNFLTKNIKTYLIGSQGRQKKVFYGSDALSQILLYRANADIARLVKGGNSEKDEKGEKRENVETNNYTSSNLLDQCKNFEQKYQELPFVFRVLGLSEITESNLQKVIDNVDKFDILLKDNYNVVFDEVELQSIAGELNQKRNLYRNWTVKVGQIRKKLPWWMKILVSLIFFGLTTYIGGSTLIILPIFVFVRQYVKTKADLYEGQEYNVNSMLKKNEDYISKLNNTNKEKDSLSFSQRRWLKDNYDTVPLLITKHRISAEKALSMLSTFISQRNIPKIKEIVHMIIARLGMGYKYGVSLLSFVDQQKKELTMLKLYKSLILGGVIVGWDLSEEDGFASVKSGEIYKSIILDSDIYLKSAIKKYKKRTFGKALQDGVISGVVAGFTAWISSELLSPTKTVASVYASDTVTKISLDKNSPLRQILEKSGVSGETTDKTLEELTKIIDDQKGFYMKGSDIYERGGLVVDSKLTGLNHIIPNDVREHLLDLVRNGKTDSTLRETMVRMSGDNRGNEFTQQLVDELWKAQNTNGLSELFQLAKQNGLETNIDSTQRTRVMKILDNIYGYEGFGQYRQFVDKNRLSVHLDKIISGEVDAEALSHYTSEQRSVLSQTAFIYVHKDSFEELFFDQVSGGKIGQLIKSPLSGGGQGIVDNGVSLTGSLPTQGGLDLFDGLDSLGIKSVPFSFGRNRIVEDME